MSAQILSNVPWSLLVWIVVLYLLWRLAKNIVWIGAVILIGYYAIALFK